MFDRFSSYFFESETNTIIFFFIWQYFLYFCIVYITSLYTHSRMGSEDSPFGNENLRGNLSILRGIKMFWHNIFPVWKCVPMYNSVERIHLICIRLQYESSQHAIDMAMKEDAKLAETWCLQVYSYLDRYSFFDLCDRELLYDRLSNIIHSQTLIVF